MAAPPRLKWTREDYERDAREYLASLPLEHFMEATPQSSQRDVTTSSFAVARLRRGNLHCFGELLIHGRKDDAFLRACPDNMIVVGDIGDEPRLSYALEHEPEPVFWAMEYVSESNKRKDYDDNYKKYQNDFHIPYYLIFHPEGQDLQLYRLSDTGSGYAPVRPNEHGRLPVREINMEVALQGGWVRYWLEGELLPITTELEKQLQEQRRQVLELQADLQKRDEVIRQRDEALRQREEDLRQRDEAIRQQRQREESLAAMLRPLVEAKARQVGRDDILTRLKETDSQQLARWLSELG